RGLASEAGGRLAALPSVNGRPLPCKDRPSVRSRDGPRSTPLRPPSPSGRTRLEGRCPPPNLERKPNNVSLSQDHLAPFAFRDVCVIHHVTALSTRCVGATQGNEEGEMKRQASRRARWLIAPSLVVPLTGVAQLEEVIVTAQRRETNLQQTPVSVQAFSAEDLENIGIAAGRDLGIMVPNLVANPTGGGVAAPNFYIRGLPGVGIYIDGVWQSSWSFLESNMTEVERVEVLRGPQGTLFGRNTNGGAINITTRRPADEFGARLGFELGEFNRRYATAAVDVPLSDTFKTKWMVSSRQHDGYVESVTVPRALGNQDDKIFRADLLWEPTDNFSLRLTANDEDKRGTEPRIIRITNENNAQYVRYNVLAGNPEFLARARAVDPSFPESPFKSFFPSDRFTPETHMPGYPGGELGKWQTKSDTPPDGVRRDLRYYTLTVEWDISENLSLRSIMSDWELHRQQDVDFDGSEFTFTTDTN